MHRPTAGILAIVLLTVGIGLSIGSESEIWQHFGGSCWKFGVLVGLIWFAHPQLKKMPLWLPPMLLISLLIGLRWPKMLLWLLLAAVILYVIDPKKRRWPTSGRESTKPNRPPPSRKREV